MTKGTPGSVEFEWADPVPNFGRGPVIDLTDQLEQVRANPGRWARVLTRSGKQAAEKAADRVREGRVFGSQPDDRDRMEVTVAQHRPDGATKVVWGIYVRASENGTPPQPRNPSARPKSAATDGKLPYICDHCDADFSTPAGLSHHVARQH